MSPDEIEHLVKYNERKDIPPSRLRLRIGTSYCIVLLNEIGRSFSKYFTRLDHKELIETHNSDVGVDALTCEFVTPLKNPEDLIIKRKKVRKWEVHYDGKQLLIPLQTAKVSTEIPCPIGVVVTGKQNLRDGVKILSATFLAKTMPTPYISDEWGDSWNDNYFMEPRLIESAPATVFACINGILDAGKRAYTAGAYDVAATKYRKAFHYSHKFYPENLEEGELQTATNLKMKSLLNLALAGIKSGEQEWLNKAFEAMDFILGMPECKGENRAKALYRRGRAKLMLGDDVSAQTDFQDSLNELDDPQTRAALNDCKKVREQRTARLKEKMSKAFN